MINKPEPPKLIIIKDGQTSIKEPRFNRLDIFFFGCLFLFYAFSFGWYFGYNHAINTINQQKIDRIDKIDKIDKIEVPKDKIDKEEKKQESVFRLI